MPDIVITPNRGTTSNPKIDFTGVTAGTIKLEVLADGTIAWNGANGSLFSIADSLSGSLMSVNDISGLPAFEVFSDNRVVIGQFGANLLLGKTTNSSNGRLQLTSSTASSGGIGFGTDTSLYRAGAGELRLNYNGGTTVLRFLNNSGNSSSIGMSNTYDLQLKSDGGSGQITFWPSNVLALTLSSSQAATFAGAVSTSGLITVGLTGTSGTTDTTLNLTTTQTTAGSGTKIRFGSTTYAGLAEIHGGNAAGGQDGFLDFYVRNGGTPTQYVRITSTGKVGIGTTAPQQPLHVNASTNYQGFLLNGNSAPSVGFVRSSNTTPEWKVGVSGSMSTSFSISKGASNDDKLIVDTDGKVGIGTTDPKYQLHVSSPNTASYFPLTLSSGVIGTSGNTVGIRFGYIGDQYQKGAIIYEGLDGFGIGKMHFAMNAASSTANAVLADSKFTILSTGNIGIGTTAPAYKLDVVGASSTDSYIRSIGGAGATKGGFIIGNNDATKDYGRFYWDNASNVAVLRHDYSSGYLGLGANTRTTDLVILASSGNVGIGTTTPTSKLSVVTGGAEISGTANTNGYLLEVKGTAASGGFLPYGNNVQSKSYWAMSNALTVGSAYSATVPSDGNAIFSGNVGIGTTSPASKLHISGSSGTIISITDNTLYSNSITNANAVMTYTVDTGNAAAGSAAHIFKRYATELVRIDQNGNVGIGTTSPSQKLEVGNFLDAVTNKITVSARYEYEPEFNFRLGQSGTGYDWIGAVISSGDDGNYNGKISFKTANGGRDTPTTKMVIKASGNVGIGTTTPKGVLDLNFGGYADPVGLTDVSIGALRMSGSGGLTAISSRQYDSINQPAGGDIQFLNLFYNGSTYNWYERMRIRANGNVGIGTTAPAYKLHVSGTGYISGALTSGGRIAATGATCELYLDSGASNSTITSYGSGVYKDLWIRTLSSSSDGVWIKADTGRVGVGVAAPSEKLEVNGNILSGNSVANNSISVTRTGANSSSLAIQAFTDSPAINWNGAGGYFRFIYGATEQMRLDSTGNVGIGTTSPSPYKLSVDQGAVVQYPINLVSSGKFVRIGALNASYAHVDTDAASGFYFYDQVETGSGNSRLGLSNQTTYFALNGGNVGIGTSAPSVLFQVSSAASGNFKLDSNGSGGHYYQAESNARLGFGRDLVTSAGHISFTMGGGSVATLGSAITMPANSQLGFYTSNGTSLVERMRLDGSGNVGIGTTNPAYKLEVSGSVADSIGNIRILPQNSRSAAYTTVLSDSGKHILHPSADTTARTFTIDSNTNVAYPIGTAITFINQNGAGVVTIAITSDTMRLAGAGTNGSRTLAANGVATAVKITSTEWIISGTGLT